MKNARGAKRQAQATLKEGASARREGDRPTRSSKRHINFVELGSFDDEMGEELQQDEKVFGLLFTAADPRYIGKDTAEAGSVILNADDVRQLLHREGSTECPNRTVWLTTSQMGSPIHAAEGEIVSGKDIEENRLTERCVAPIISSFIRGRWSGDRESASQNSALRQLWLLDQEWGEAREDVEPHTREAKRIK